MTRLDADYLWKSFDACETLPGVVFFRGGSSQQWCVGLWQGSEEAQVLDGFGGILFADENFQEAQFGLDPLVLPVLLRHVHSVLLLNISAKQEGDRGGSIFISVSWRSLCSVVPSDKCVVVFNQFGQEASNYLTSLEQEHLIMDWSSKESIFIIYKLVKSILQVWRRTECNNGELKGKLGC